ncbi:MAG: flavodoxin domain-containing protein [Verrucomicrobiota bacterium]
MKGTILVAYASRYGSTREVAESIASALRERTLRVVLRPAVEVHHLDEYVGVVLGGGLYMGRWHRDARGFVRHFADDLGGLPVAVFALGPTDEVPEHRAGSEKQFRKAVDKLPFEPIASAVFGGAIDPRKLHFPLNRMPSVDIRDWDAIAAWADEVAERFLSLPVAA